MGEMIAMMGVTLMDRYETGALVIIAVVVALDGFLGLRDRWALGFAMLQIAGLVAGYFWALSVFEQQDVAAPWAMGHVIGAWLVCAVLFHVWYVLWGLKPR